MANGCPWDKYTCALAAKRGHLELLKWLRANGCPWNQQLAIEWAEMRGHTEVLQWLRSLDA